MNFSKFIEKLRFFLDNSEMTQSELAAISDIPASQLSEWLNERRGVRMGKNAYKVLNTITREYQKEKLPIPIEIEEAIRKTWNGDHDRIKIIVNLIESLEPAFDYNKTTEHLRKVNNT